MQPQTEETETALLNFPAALKAIMEGREVTRESWNDPRNKVSRFNGRVCLAVRRERYIPLPYVLTDTDLFATDWYILS